MIETEVGPVYDRQAASYDAGRARVLFERAWLERFAHGLPSGGRVLDLGCGAGEPIARWLIENGFRVIGIDLSAAMLAIARRRWPKGDWRQADMRRLDLGERFDGILGWDSFFHLTPDDQRATIPVLARHLAPGGVLLLTVGPDRAEATGHVGGEKVYHASLSPADYAVRLKDCGLRLTGFLAEDPDCDFHSVLMARKDHPCRTEEENRCQS